MLILGTYKTSAVSPIKRIARLAIMTFAIASYSFSAIAQLGEIGTTPVSGTVLVQIDQSNTLGMPPPVGVQNPAVSKNAKPMESLLPPTPASIPKIYTQAATSSSSELDLRQLWTELKLNNPQLASLRESYLSAKATVPQIAAPANPQVGLVWSGMPPNSPLGLGGANAPTAQNPTGISSNNSISFAQPFQFPGKKSLASDIANTNAEALLAQSEATYLQLGAQLSSLFFSALASQKQLQVLRDSVVRLEMIKNVAKARYSNNAAAYVEYLNAQVAQSAAQADQFNAERQLDVAIKSINTLVGRHAREKLVLRADVRRALNNVPTLVELEDYAETSHPSLKSSSLQLEAARKGVDLAKKAYLPDFQVIGSSYTPRGPFAANNGAMFYQVEFDLIIPLYFFTKEKYGVEQAQRSQAAAEAGNISNRQQIVLGVNTAYAVYEQAKNQTQFLRDRQVPQADAAYKVGLTQYSNNGQGFNDLLTAQTQLRNLEIGLAQAESNLMQAQAVLYVSAGREPF